MRLFTNIKRQEIINLSLFSVSLIPILLYIFVVYQRIALPIDLEWGEGAGINQIYQILAGGQLYLRPSGDFMALVYPPFYYWLASVLAKMGVQVQLAGRMLSWLASLGTAVLIGWIVIKETEENLAGWLSGALYLACFALSDGFYDLVRVDSLYVFLLLLAFVMLRFSSHPARWLGSGLIIALAIYTKQSALIVFLPLIIYLIYQEKKQIWPLLLTVVGSVIIPFLWINVTSDGWFAYYLLELPRQHGYSLVSAVDFWVGDLLGPLGIAIGLGMVYLFLNLRIPSDKETSQGSGRRKNQVMYYLLFGLGSVVAAWITRTSNGGGANNTMSAYAIVALLFGLGFSALAQMIERMDVDRDLYKVLFSSIVAIQFIGLMYNPFNFIPSAFDRSLNEELVSEMAEVTGPVWIPFRSHLPRLAGKDATLHAVNLFEVTGYFKGEVLPEGRKLVNQIRENICRQTYGMIVLDQPIPWIDQQLAIAYQEASPLTALGSGRRSTQLTWQGGFEAIYYPREGSDLAGCLSTIDHEGEK